MVKVHPGGVAGLISLARLTRKSQGQGPDIKWGLRSEKKMGCRGPGQNERLQTRASLYFSSLFTCVDIRVIIFVNPGYY